ncbi:hypothetical protein [Formosa sp. L2A11]|uniref:hypothetical protein n=1 Tax=Formosa sp. L2A11 TaxID=2686363 RepID=UPI00351B2E27
MGLFSFIKDAGVNIFGLGKTEEVAEAAVRVEETILGLNLEVDDLNVKIDLDKAVVAGIAQD